MRMNKDGELLMMLQDRPDVKEVELRWSVQSGAKFENEIFEQC
ncbi:hypothetical protein [Bacillus rhizoplanae]